MINAAIILFALSAVLGLTILIKWLSQKDASKTVIYSHGIVAAAALALLVAYAYQHPENFPKISLVLFLIAAVTGFYMFYLDLNKRLHPLAVALTHALVAVSAFVLLLLFAFE